MRKVPQHSVIRIPRPDPLQSAQWILHQGELAAGDPQFLYLARSIVREVRELDRLSEALAICDWVENSVRYTSDPVQYEAIWGPWAMLDLIRSFGRWAEDCDGIIALTYGLLRSVGHTVRICVVGFDPVPAPEHIFLQVQINSFWITIDPSEKASTGDMLRDVRWWWVFSPQ